MLPGLILVEDLIDRLPKQRDAILRYEIRRRERELLYIGSTQQVLRYHFFSAAKGPVLRGVCIPLHVGRTTSVWQTTITDADGRTVAMVVQTQVALPAGGD